MKTLYDSHSVVQRGYPDGKARRILFVVNQLEFFLSHRLPVAVAAAKVGYDVHVATGGAQRSKELQSQGLTHHLVPISRSGSNLLSELRTVKCLWRLMREVKPDIVHLVTIKPVLYGGLVSRLTHVPGVVVAITGLGSTFVSQSLRGRLLRVFIRFLYRMALVHKNLHPIFQNKENLTVLETMGLVNRNSAYIIPGSGVKLEDYTVAPEPTGVPVIAFAARLLKEKGVLDFIEAARIIKSRGFKARFWLIGRPDPDNPSSITEDDLKEIEREGFVETLGFRNDIATLFAQANIITLPSYYGEGLPKVLIEAAASGRPVVTTDHPGCRDAIEPQQTGLLVPVRDPVALADALEQLLKDRELRLRFGKAGRKLAENKFSIQQVVTAHLNIYRSVLEKCETDVPS